MLRFHFTALVCAAPQALSYMHHSGHIHGCTALVGPLPPHAGMPMHLFTPLKHGNSPTALQTSPQVARPDRQPPAKCTTTAAFYDAQCWWSHCHPPQAFRCIRIHQTSTTQALTSSCPHRRWPRPASRVLSCMHHPCHIVQCVGLVKPPPHTEGNPVHSFASCKDRTSLATARPSPPGPRPARGRSAVCTTYVTFLSA